jgi:hypothetical protein
MVGDDKDTPWAAPLARFLMLSLGHFWPLFSLKKSVKGPDLSII